MKCINQICRITLQEWGRQIHMQVGPINNTSNLFWKCQFIFEALILFPLPKEQQVANYSCMPQAWIQQLQKGNIISLNKKAFNLEQDTAPLVRTPPSFNNETTFSHSAQVAADADNYRVASQCMQSYIRPTVNIADKISEEIKNLYPEWITFVSFTSEQIDPQHTRKHNTNNQKQIYKQKHWTLPHQPWINHCALWNTRKGTALGPLIPSMDFIWAYAWIRNRWQNDSTYAYLDTFIKRLDIAKDNQLSPTATLNFGPWQYFIALYKDTSVLKRNDQYWSTLASDNM